MIADDAQDFHKSSDEENPSGLKLETGDFGTIAVRNGLLKREELERCIEKKKKFDLDGRRMTLEQIIEDDGLMTKTEIKAVQKARERFLREIARTEGTKITGYEIISTLGEGGLGIVYKARQISMNRLVALKVLHKHWVTDDEFRKRFILEARIVGKLSHQNLIQVYDVGKEEGYYYFSMEYVPGRTIDQLIEEKGILSVSEAVNTIIQIVRALRYYKEFDIVHRDIKPSNIIVTQQNIAKLGDFGFVKSKLDKELGFEGMVLGTPDYISPEQAMGDDSLDWRSDIYSLGATFYHMVTGVPPFEGSGSTVMLKHVKEKVVSPKSINFRLSDDVCQVIERMMEKRPEDRYATLELLFEDLELLRAGRSTRAPRLEVGKSSIFRAFKIEQARLASITEEKRKIEDKIKKYSNSMKIMIYLSIALGITVVTFITLFILAVSGII